MLGCLVSYYLYDKIQFYLLVNMNNNLSAPIIVISGVLLKGHLSSILF